MYSRTALHRLLSGDEECLSRCISGEYASLSYCRGTCGAGLLAYSPDLPGCVATGKTHDEVTRHMYEAIQMHLQGMREDNLPVPKGRSSAE